MKPIRSIWEICITHGLLPSQITILQALIQRRRGVLHPYWIQLALFVPNDFARRLHDELIVNEWAVPDVIETDGIFYESELTVAEIEIIAHIDLYATS